MTQTVKAERFFAFPFLLIAGIASAFMLFFGLFAAGWGGAWAGYDTSDRVLHLLFWVLPTLSIVAFVTYFFSKGTGLFSSWAISVGSVMVLFGMNLRNCLASGCTTTNLAKIAFGVFLNPHVWILLIAPCGLQMGFALTKSSAIRNGAKTRIDD